MNPGGSDGIRVMGVRHGSCPHPLTRDPLRGYPAVEPGEGEPSSSLGTHLPGLQPDSVSDDSAARYQELQAELELRLLLLVDQLRAHIATVAADLGLTPQQAMLLRRLGQPQTMGDIAEALACDRSNVTGLVDRLTARGLMQRVPDAVDRRIKHLVLTEEGQALRAQLQARLFADSPAIDALRPTERFQFLQILRTLTPEITAPERGQYDAWSPAVAPATETSRSR